mgnify:CR=1 FL=1
MRKLSLLFVSMLVGTIGFSQAVADQAIIPVSVGLNSILRLNVTSGGNIEFVVNTITDYTSGIANSPRYTTGFTVASSIDFDVTLALEDADLAGVDVAGTFDHRNLGYRVAKTGSGTIGTDWTIPSSGATAIPVSGTGTDIIESITNHGAGDVAKNAFTINWRLAQNDVLTVTAANGGWEDATKTLLSQSIPAGRYTTNVFLVLKAHD